jgi:hypothetical protein
MAHQPSGSSAVLFAGVALLALGLVAESRQQPQSVPQLPSYATADSNGSMIAVTGIDVTGGSLLYLIDTEARQLAVYQANGGTSSTMSIQFVGARNIDLDLQLDGCNDESEYSYKDLKAEFEKNEAKAQEAEDR